VTFWLDSQLPPELCPWLGVRFQVEAKHLLELGLLKAKDEELYAAGRRFNGIVIMTKDKDFPELSRRLGPPPQILFLRCGNLSTLLLQSLLAVTFADALRKLERGEALVEIAIP
jgi:predicted nuclease of predicted toxin-antitoxin system